MASMLVFVRRSDLINDPVRVMAFYDELSALPLDFMGAECTRLSLPQEAIIKPTYDVLNPDPTAMIPKLVSDFRVQYMRQMVLAEASRRINLAFPDYMQRNSNADINNSTMKYGAGYGTWPPDAQARKAEGDRGWQFISDVRRVSDALETQTSTTDPTDDAHWPTQISPVYIDTVGTST
jgi:hypothetical protein